MNTPAVTAIRAPDLPAPELPAPYSLRWRAGVGIPDGGDPADFRWTTPRPGWYLNWHHATLADALPPPDLDPDESDIEGTDIEGTGIEDGAHDADALPDYLFAPVVIPNDDLVGMEFVPMVYDLAVATDTLESVVRQLPGRTWLIGNEPDVRWQGNLTPEAYAAGYHRVYNLIKGIDPAAQIAIGGVSQVTPLRLAYLERILDAYETTYGEPIPVDVWTIHTFILQEKRDDWGVDIPPGFDHVDVGTLWSIEDHGDLDLVRQQIRVMRAWMHARGEVNKPLWITEYGILMPEAYGFPPARVAEYMLQSFDLFQDLRDPNLGWAEDDYRLVQRWVWFSAGYERYPTGDLFAAGEATHLMETFSAYLAEHGP